tara:strand:- start:191 stop:376 length:186 start_codon:yes stop_codon:yes gene_type:complete
VKSPAQRVTFLFLYLLIKKIDSKSWDKVLYLHSVFAPIAQLDGPPLRRVLDFGKLPIESKL